MKFTNTKKERIWNSSGNVYADYLKVNPITITNGDFSGITNVSYTNEARYYYASTTDRVDTIVTPVRDEI